MMTNAEVHTAIIGAGHAGVECACALRSFGVQGPIALISDEAHAPYERPPLSKALLLGATDVTRIVLRSEAVFEKLGLIRIQGDPVETLDPRTHTLGTRSGRTLRFAHAVLATGAIARGLPGLQGEGVYAVRNADDSLLLRAALAPGGRLLVVGGGYLGLEAASSAAKLGVAVTVLEAADGIMPGKVSPLTAERFAAMHRGAGIELVHGAAVQSWRRTEGQWHATLADGRVYRAPAVLVAIGAVANTSLAERAGIACQGGVVVDAACRTSAPDIYAVGDCSIGYRRELGLSMRIESVQNAMAQARIAACAIAGKAPTPERVPTFWSEQHGCRLQMAGMVHPGRPCHDEMIDTPRGWIVERRQEGRLVAVEAVDSPAEFVRAVQRLNAVWQEPA
ncbi:NAD(P)/FAD-dependent oxidoreductase [Bordetella genomosp. 9]|uniref:NAD(P)/FAD-dependent oxidoreductase n=1 Tax=Bordetella genomosp. 9 TaxID=1416803 RepID=UPI001E2EA4A0|nr:FAD-dependent oxidoreductase [Bordetella genomosp. 9]